MAKYALLACIITIESAELVILLPTQQVVSSAHVMGLLLMLVAYFGCDDGTVTCSWA